MPMTQRIPLFLLILFFGITSVFGQAVVVPPDSTESPTPDVDDFLFDTEGLDDEDADLGGYNPGVMWNSSREGRKKHHSADKKRAAFQRLRIAISL